MNCTGDYLISEAIALGGSLNNTFKSNNEDNCKTYSNKISLITNYCNNLDNFQKSITKYQCKDQKFCDIVIDFTDKALSCNSNLSFGTLYLSYSCYGKKIYFIKLRSIYWYI